MPKRAWTFLVVPHDDIRVRRLKLSSWVLSLIFFFCLAGLVSIGYLTISSCSKTFSQLKLINLQEENSLLTQKLVTVEDKISNLNAKISQLLEENQLFRRIAGLQDIDKEVIEVGVGGAYLDNYDELFEMNSEVAKKLYSQEQDIEVLLRKGDLISQSLQESIHSMQASSDKWAHYPSISPTQGYISSPFGKRFHPIFHKVQFHNAIDISSWIGEPILATADGQVIMSRQQTGYGLTVVVDHGFGIVTKYAHCSKSVVNNGQKVKRGEVIAYVGKSGITTGPNLHYEVVVDGIPRNPVNFILDNYYVP